MQKICIDGQCLKHCLLSFFKWKENIHKFDEDFIKNYDEDSDKEYILEEDVEYPKSLPNIHGHFPFLAEEL